MAFLSSQIRRATVAVVVGVFVFAQAAFAVDHGRYLPDPLNLSNQTSETYGSLTPTEFDQDVFCDGVKIGEIRFTYDTWSALDNSNDLNGGGALAGGFWSNGVCDPDPGWQFGWVQIVRSTFSGNNVWNAPDGSWFPDTDDKQDPDYPFETLPTLDSPPNPAPTVGFQDFPNRYPDMGDQFWQAELGLVCKNLATAEMKVMGTFLWGFDVDEDPAGIDPAPPGFWSDPTTNYINTLTSHFSGLDGSTQWSVSAGCCCTIPEPAGLALASLALLPVARRRRAA